MYNNAPNQSTNFEIRLYESSSRIDFVYGNINGNGNNVTVGIQKGSGVQWTQFSCNNSILSNGLEVIFTPIVCGTATPTSTPTPTPLLVGHVTWQGPPAQPNALQQLPITLSLQMAATQVSYPSQNTDASGFFTVSVAGLPSGTYTWRAKGPKYLSNSGTVALTGAARTNQEMGLMRAGDCNNDNVDNATDFSILRATYGKAQGQPGYDDRADFTGDLTVSALDFNLLRSNFGAGGASPGGPGISP